MLLTAYRNTTSVSCDILKANKLMENGDDNFKGKELILKVLRTEDLLTMFTKKRERPRCSDSNPSGYSARKMIIDDEGDHVISADDQNMYAHDFARLYVAINIATSESLQFLFPEATTFGNEILLLDSILARIFGTTYKCSLIPYYMYMYITYIYIYMLYSIQDPRYTLPYIPIRVLHYTKLQTLFTISSHHCHLAC